MRNLGKPELRNIASEAYAYGLNSGPNTYDRGYASGVEDLARLLSQRDPAISERLATILRGADMVYALPPSTR